MNAQRDLPTAIVEDMLAGRRFAFAGGYDANYRPVLHVDRKRYATTDTWPAFSATEWSYSASDEGKKRRPSRYVTLVVQDTDQLLLSNYITLSASGIPLPPDQQQVTFTDSEQANWPLDVQYNLQYAQYFFEPQIHHSVFGRWPLVLGSTPRIYDASKVGQPDNPNPWIQQVQWNRPQGPWPDWSPSAQATPYKHLDFRPVFQVTNRNEYPPPPRNEEEDHGCAPNVAVCSIGAFQWQPNPYHDPDDPTSPPWRIWSYPVLIDWNNAPVPRHAHWETINAQSIAAGQRTRFPALELNHLRAKYSEPQDVTSWLLLERLTLEQRFLYEYGGITFRVWTGSEIPHQDPGSVEPGYLYMLESVPMTIDGIRVRRNGQVVYSDLEGGLPQVQRVDEGTWPSNGGWWQIASPTKTCRNVRPAVDDLDVCMDARLAGRTVHSVVKGGYVAHDRFLVVLRAVTCATLQPVYAYVLTDGQTDTSVVGNEPELYQECVVEWDRSNARYKLFLMAGVIPT